MNEVKVHSLKLNSSEIGSSTSINDLCREGRRIISSQNLLLSCSFPLLTISLENGFPYFIIKEAVTEVIWQNLKSGLTASNLNAQE